PTHTFCRPWPTSQLYRNDRGGKAPRIVIITPAAQASATTLIIYR
ncbi:hypothetical protein LLOABG_LLOABG_04830, partial [Dysosmobacter welbionis]